MNITVIICTLNNCKMLDELLESISEQDVQPLETIVVHGESDSETKSIVRKWNFGGLSTKYISAPRSLVIQRNLGIENASGEIICFLDDDVILEQGYFKSIIYAYQQDSSLGGVQGTISNNLKPNFFKIIFYRLFLLDNTFGNGKLQKSGLPSFHRNVPYPVEVEVFNGCLMTYKASVLKNCNFDLFYEKNWWGDDYETSYNVSKRHKLLQIPSARLFHYGNASFSKSTKLAYMRGKNLGYIRNKHNLCKGINKVFCIWSDFGQFFYYFLLFFKGEGFGYMNSWIKGVKEEEY